jgi:cell division protease FtsH
MVTKYGFSDKLGPVNYSSSEEVFLGKDFTTHKNYSEEIASEIDEEIKAMIEEAFERAEKILEENSEPLHRVAKALLEIETLDGEQFESLFKGDLTLDELVDQIRTEEKDIREKNAQEAAETELLLAEAAAAEAAAEEEAQRENMPEPYVDGRQRESYEDDASEDEDEYEEEDSEYEEDAEETYYEEDHAAEESTDDEGEASGTEEGVSEDEASKRDATDESQGRK